MRDFIALDFETSGLNFRTDQIIEACIIVVRNGEPVTIFNTLVKPTDELRGAGLNPKVAEITGYTLEDLDEGIEESDLAELINILLRLRGSEGALLVAYNGLFDLSFADSLLLKYGMVGIENNFLDPLTVARDRHKYPHKLGDMCKRYGVPLEDAHSAYADTMALVDLVFAMDKEDAGKGGKPLDWYINKAGYKRKFGEPEWITPQAVPYPQGAMPDVIHTKKPGNKKAVPKYEKIATNNKAKRKKLPDFARMDNTEFTKEHMPTDFVNDNYNYTRVDEDPFAQGRRYPIEISEDDLPF